MEVEIGARTSSPGRSLAASDASFNNSVPSLQMNVLLGFIIHCPLTMSTADARALTDSTLPFILRLPLELRQQIYTHLIPRTNTSHPLPSIGITSVSHRPPTFALLSIHPQITIELIDFFYNLATWKLIFSHAFNFFRIDPDLRHLESSPSLHRLQKVEVVFYCDILLLKEYPSFGLESFCAEIKRRADRACDVLLLARELRDVTVSWIDTTCTGNWVDKAKVLEPLRKLTSKVTFRCGEISGPDEEVDCASFVEAMRAMLGVDHAEAKRSDEESQPSNIRLLAFDVRQERHLVASRTNAFGNVSSL